MRTLTLALIIGLVTPFLVNTDLKAQGKSPEVPAAKEQVTQQGSKLSYFAHVEYDEKTHETHLKPVLPEGTSDKMKKTVLTHANLQFGDHEKAKEEHDETATLFDFGKFMKSAQRKAARVTKAVNEGGDWQKVLGEQALKGVKDVAREAVKDPTVQAEVKKQATAAAQKIVEEATKKAGETVKTALENVVTPTPTTGPKVPPPLPAKTGMANLPPPMDVSKLPPPPPAVTPGAPTTLPPPPANLPPPPAYTPPAPVAKVDPHPPAAPPRAGLLSEIQAGKKLRKVETPKPTAAAPTGLLGQIQAGTTLKSVKDRKLAGPIPESEATDLQSTLRKSLEHMRPSISGGDDESPTGDDEWDD